MPLGSQPCTAIVFSTAWQEQAEACPRFWVSADQLGQLKPVWLSWHLVWILLYLTSEVLNLTPNPSDPQPKLWERWMNWPSFCVCTIYPHPPSPWSLPTKVFMPSEYCWMLFKAGLCNCWGHPTQDCYCSEHLLDIRPCKKISIVKKMKWSALQECSHLSLRMTL